MTPKSREVANFGMFFHVMQIIHFIHVCVLFAQGLWCLLVPHTDQGRENSSEYDLRSPILTSVKHLYAYELVES